MRDSLWRHRILLRALGSIPTLALGLALGLTFGLMGCGGAQEASRGLDPERFAPHNLYPLQEGNVWSYNVDTGSELPALAITRVIATIGSRIEVSSGGDPIVYEKRGEGIYRPASDTWLLQSPIQEGAEWPSTGGRTARVTSVTASVETPAGEFTDCVRVEEGGGDDGKSINTVYCPGVGPVFLETQMQLTMTERPARVIARLLGWNLAGR
ncbi:MAG: hypothetical protein AAGF12_14820 [Myxococcota bacterium]